MTKLEEKLATVTKACDQHAKNEERLREDLVKESQVRQTVESEWNAKADQHKVETERLQSQLLKSEEILESLKVSYSANYKVTLHYLFRYDTINKQHPVLPVHLF